MAAQRRERWTAVALVVALTFLVGVKRQYFLAVLLAFLPAVLSGYLRAARGRTGYLTMAAACVALPGTVFVFTRHLMHVPPDAHPMCPGTLTGLIATMVRAGLPYVLSYGGQGISTQVHSAFLGGQAMWMYWVAFGAYGNQMTIVSKPFTAVVFSSAVGISVVAEFLVAVRLLSVWRRLVSVWTRRSWRSALHVASGNVAVNAYFFFVVILLAYEASVSGVVGIQGRYWLPFVPVVWYVLVFIAPRPLPRGYGKAFSKILLTGLLIFCFVATLYIPYSIRHRYYDPPVADTSAETLVFIEPEADPPKSDLGTVTRGTPLRLYGIAEDLRTPAAPKRVVVRVDGATDFAAIAQERLDFACANTFYPLRGAGYRVDVRTDNLAAGTHSIDFWLAVPWSAGLVHTRRHATFVVTDPDAKNGR